MKKIIFPKTIKIEENIEMIKIDKDIDVAKLRSNLFILYDQEAISFLGFENDIDKEIVDMLHKINNTDRYVYYSIYKDSGFIGIFYLYDVNHKNQRANISLGIIPSKRGYVLSIDRMKTLLFELFNLGFIRLAMEIEDTNEKSLRLANHMQNIGFVYEGKLRDNYGININSNVWSILKREFRF